MNFLDGNLIREALPPELRSIGITVFDSIDSTNSYAKRLKTTDAQLIAADTQTGGRGRVGKSFYSPKGTGIYMSLLIKTPSSAEYVTVAAAVAAVRVLHRLGAENIGIKWVNDIFSGGRKVCGILCERTAENVIIGIGINLLTANFPEDIADVAGAVGISCDRNRFIAELTAELFSVIAMNSDLVVEEYKQNLFILGREIEYTKDGKVHTAVAVGINQKGNLVVESDGKTKILSSGEISLKSKNFTNKTDRQYR